MPSPALSPDRIRWTHRLATEKRLRDEAEIRVATLEKEVQDTARAAVKAASAGRLPDLRQDGPWAEVSPASRWESSIGVDRSSLIGRPSGSASPPGAALAAISAERDVLFERLSATEARLMALEEDRAFLRHQLTVADSRFSADSVASAARRQRAYEREGRQRVDFDLDTPASGVGPGFSLSPHQRSLSTSQISVREAELQEEVAMLRRQLAAECRRKCRVEMRISALEGERDKLWNQRIAEEERRERAEARLRVCEHELAASDGAQASDLLPGTAPEDELATARSCDEPQDGATWTRKIQAFVKERQDLRARLQGEEARRESLERRLSELGDLPGDHVRSVRPGFADTWPHGRKNGLLDSGEAAAADGRLLAELHDEQRRRRCEAAEVCSLRNRMTQELVEARAYYDDLGRFEAANSGLMSEIAEERQKLATEALELSRLRHALAAAQQQAHLRHVEDHGRLEHIEAASSHALVDLAQARAQLGAEAAEVSRLVELLAQERARARACLDDRGRLAAEQDALLAAIADDRQRSAAEAREVTRLTDLIADEQRQALARCREDRRGLERAEAASSQALAELARERAGRGAEATEVSSLRRTLAQGEQQRAAERESAHHIVLRAEAKALTSEYTTVALARILDLQVQGLTGELAVTRAETRDSRRLAFECDELQLRVQQDLERRREARQQAEVFADEWAALQSELHLASSRSLRESSLEAAARHRAEASELGLHAKSAMLEGAVMRERWRWESVESQLHEDYEASLKVFRAMEAGTSYPPAKAFGIFSPLRKWPGAEDVAAFRQRLAVSDSLSKENMEMHVEMQKHVIMRALRARGSAKRSPISSPRTLADIDSY